MSDQSTPQFSSAWIRRSLEEVSRFATEEMLAAFQDAALDDERWEAAKSDPRKFLLDKGLPVPETIDSVFEDQAPSEGAAPVRRCLKICRREPPPDPGVPPIVWCYEICLLWR